MLFYDVLGSFPSIAQSMQCGLFCKIYIFFDRSYKKPGICKVSKKTSFKRWMIYFQLTEEGEDVFIFVVCHSKNYMNIIENSIFYQNNVSILQFWVSIAMVLSPGVNVSLIVLIDLRNPNWGLFFKRSIIYYFNLPKNDLSSVR